MASIVMKDGGNSLEMKTKNREYEEGNTLQRTTLFTTWKGWKREFGLTERRELNHRSSH
jgi:hypothetical protein